MAPTIVIVPGLWVGPRAYELLVEQMKIAAPSLKDFVYAPLQSTGKSSPGNPNMFDDAMGVRKVIKPLVEQDGKRLVIIGHSAGALISAMATEDLEVGQKLAAPRQAGVERFVFISGGILPVGAMYPQMGMLDIKDGKAFCKDTDRLLFHDVDPSLAKKYEALFECQPASDWYSKCTYAGWDKVPSTYVLCQKDRIISPEVQQRCAGIAGSDIVSLDLGHMSMLANPKLLAEKIVQSLSLKSKA